MRIRNQRDFFSGLLFMAIGLCFASMSWSYKLGTAREIGPGYFPFVLGSLLAVLGLVVSVRSISTRTAVVSMGEWQWRPISLISLSILIFALALPRLGLMASIALMTVISAVASEEKRTFKEMLILAVALMAFAYLVFVKGLRLPFLVWPDLRIAG